MTTSTPTASTARQLALATGRFRFLVEVVDHARDDERQATLARIEAEREIGAYRVRLAGQLRDGGHGPDNPIVADGWATWIEADGLIQDRPDPPELGDTPEF